MGNRQNVIMLNGKRYDSVTGEQLSSGAVPHKSSTHLKLPQQTKQSASPARTVDGFTKRKTVNSTNRAERKPEKSRTLMRGAVKKPAAVNHKKQNKVVTKTKTISNPSAHTDPVRELRAAETKRSKLISRFGEVKNKVKFAPLAVVEPPKQTQENSGTNDSTDRPTPQSSTANQPSRFEKVIETAESHKQLKAKKHNRRARVARKLKISPRILNVTMTMGVVLIIGGYVAFNNVPNLAMQIAATRSGVDADLPEYQPSGFAIKGPIKYQPGQITINFGSNSDQRSYVVNQSKSEWNSESLLENHVATNNRAYQTFQEKGKTIYLYDGDNASWVDNGIWYEIDGNSALNSDQIIRIANSL